jgi:hypothetical protein
MGRESDLQGIIQVIKDRLRKMTIRVQGAEERLDVEKWNNCFMISKGACLFRTNNWNDLY